MNEEGKTFMGRPGRGSAYKGWLRGVLRPEFRRRKPGERRQEKSASHHPLSPLKTH